MIRLLRFLTWRHFLRHRLRTFLTFLGIVLGVAVIVAIAIVNRALVGSFQRTIDRVAGKAVLQVTDGESGLQESLFPLVRDTEGVQDAAPALAGFLPVAGAEGERLWVYGVDFLADFSVRDHRFVGDSFRFENALDFIARPDSIALTDTFSRRLGLSPGSRITLVTSRGRRSYTVRALLKTEGAARVFGGNFALMDLPVAQGAFGKEGKLDSIDLTVAEGAGIEAVRRALERRLQGRARAERPRERGEQIESLLTSFRVGLFFVSLIALFVGFFLIFNTVSVSVVQRRREIGTLRCLGMSQKSVLLLVVAESLALGFAASLAGVGAGILLADAALSLVGETVNGLFFITDLGRASVTLREVWVALGSGLGVSLLAALYPAQEAARVSPLEGARQTPWAPRFTGISSRASLIGLCFLLAVPALLLWSPVHWSNVGRFSLGVSAMMVFLLGLSFLAPLFVSGLAKLVRRTCSRRRCVEGSLASGSLARNPVRSGITVGTIMVSLAAIFTVASFVHSVRGSLLSWVDQMVTADLVVHSSAKTAGPLNVPLREELGAALAAVPGVATVDLYRLVRSTYEGKPIVVESFSARTSGALRSLPMVKGDAKEVLARMGAGDGVVVSESFWRRFGRERGDALQLATPSGIVSFAVLGIYLDYSSDQGSILMDRSLYQKYWGDGLVDAFDLWLTPGADQEAVIRKIKDRYGAPYQLFISTHRELKEAVVEVMEQSFTVNYAVEIVAVVVAIFSVVNTLLASVADRMREIGVLRAIGAAQGQLRRMVLVEAALIGSLGGVLGLFAGSVMSYHHVVYNTRILTGWTFQFHYPFHAALGSLLAAVALCLAAGYLPARRAASTGIVEAIGYE